MVRTEGRYAFCGSAAGAAGVRRVAEQGDSLLRRTPRCAAWDHGMGAGAVQVRKHARRRPGEAPIRLVLHQECLARSGYAHLAPDRKDRAAGTRSAMRWVFWGAAFLITYTYIGYVGWLWL